MVTTSLLEQHLPRFDCAERHEIRVATAPDRVWPAVLDLDFASSRVARTLFRLRGMPTSALRLEGLEKLGFVRLGERPGRELLFGLAGRFWTAGGGLRRLDPKGFESFAEPGFAKAVWSFSLAPDGEGATRLSTETRVLCLDAVSCSKFKLYWLFVRPFSGWTRREALRLIRDRAEGRR